jgi:hypothetical protein
MPDAGMALGQAGDDIRQRVAHHHRPPMGRIALACGWVVVSTGANVAGITCGLAQFAWTVAAALLAPYAAFWLWLLTTYEVFVRRTPSAGR